MQPDEQLYELAAKELANSPRQGLLIKCMAKAEGDENKAKALYIKMRVDEMKSQIAKEQKQKQVKNDAALTGNSLKAKIRDWSIILGILLIIILQLKCS